MKRVCVVTGSRAEYGLLRPLMREIENDPELEAGLLVTGTHLSPDHGLTVQEIERDGFPIAERIEIVLSSDTRVGACKMVGLAFISFGEALARLAPDLVVGLGDRFELFAAVGAAHLSGIPVAHIHGGEVTAGAFDDALRHSITKMSHLHFTSTEAYRNRVIQLGEDPERVFNVGALGLDAIRTVSPIARGELESSLGIRFGARNLLVTYHPVTLEHRTAGSQVDALLAELEARTDTTIIFTGANADPQGREVNARLRAFAARHPDRSTFVENLGQQRYFSVLAQVDAVVGNSSSGLIEASSFHVGTINIGDRQKGRVAASSVIHCAAKRDAIAQAFERLYSREFQEALPGVVNPYGDGHAAERIKRALKTACTGRLKKGFYDLLP